MTHSNHKNQRVPGIIIADTTNKQWDGVNALCVDWQPINKEAFKIPKKTGIVLGYRFEGAIKSRYQLGDDQWRQQECLKDDFMIVRAHEETKWSWQNMSHEDESLLTMIVNIEQDLINTVAAEAADVDYRLIEFNHQTNLRDHVISHYFKRLHNELMSNDPLSRFSVDILKQELTVHLLRHYSVFSQKMNDGHQGLSKKQLGLINNYIETYYYQDIALKDLSGLINLSEYHFARQYKKAAQITPYQYILHCRLTRAKQLLETTHLTIQEIAIQTGYTNASIFSKSFSKHVGVSAAQYRKQSSSANAQKARIDIQKAR